MVSNDFVLNHDWKLLAYVHEHEKGTVKIFHFKPAFQSCKCFLISSSDTEFSEVSSLILKL